MKNIFLLFGEDTYSSNQKLGYWRTGFTKKYSEDADLQILDGANLNLTEFVTNLSAMPFFAEKRMIIVKNIFANQKADELTKVSEQIDKVPEETILVFFEEGTVDKRTKLYKNLTKKADIEEFKLMNPQQTTKWILDHAKKKNLQIDFATANYLSNYSSSSLWKLSSELEKLSLYANGEQVTQTMINEVTTPSLSASVFLLTDQISQKVPKKALKTLETIADSGEDLTKVFYMIARQFRLLIQIKDMLENNESQPFIVKKLKQHPFVVQKTSQQCKNFNFSELKRSHRALLKIDEDFKTGRIKTSTTDQKELRLAIEQFILKSNQTNVPTH